MSPGLDPCYATRSYSFGAHDSFSESAWTPLKQSKIAKFHACRFTRLIIGHKHFEEAYHLAWTTSGKIIIRSSEAPGPPARHSEELDVDMAVECAWVNAEHTDKFFVMETFRKFKQPATQKPIGAQYTNFFKQGEKHRKGEIMIKFDKSLPAWADSVYKMFVDWLKPQVEKREILRGRAREIKWEVANQMALAADTRSKRASSGNSSTKRSPAKASATPGLPSVESWPPPPPTRVANEAPADQKGSIRGRGHFPDPLRKVQITMVLDRVLSVALHSREYLINPALILTRYFGFTSLRRKTQNSSGRSMFSVLFFYKKLNKKNPREGYESVRKWTSKFDLFQKKYIIIPINENLHRYLAIIYQPEHVLRPPPTKLFPVVADDESLFGDSHIITKSGKNC
ncbi:hypothetical protein C8R43DRAFT_941712 [Mycena crocata]|nr:hypothetical protein C8R43DRAFT_941712 [Mycena crocata]